MGLDLAAVRGSGPLGRVTRQDLDTVSARRKGPRPTVAPAAAPAPFLAPATITPQGPVETMPLRGLRKRIAENMTRSKHTAAHYAYVEELDATELVKLRDAATSLAEQRRVKLTLLPFVIKAAITALKAYPIVNSSYDEAKQELVFKKYYHVGVAASTEEGLIVPVVKNADKKTRLRNREGARDAGRKGPYEEGDRRGALGVHLHDHESRKARRAPCNAHRQLPRVAIMGVHAIKDKPVVKDGKVVAGNVMNLSFSFDRRILVGAVGAQFAATLIRFLEDPKLLLLEAT